MKVGTDISVLAQEGRPDAAVLAEHLALADLAEPLGFDSLFGLEHHFTGYSMSPSPLQLLSYYAAKTSRITLGTCVIVLPWHDPIRVAEQIAYLDLLCGGRCMFGFGRGAATKEYEGFRIPMEEARPRFAESAQLITKALRDEVFEWDGEYYQIPKMSIRPRPMSHPERRFYASSVSPESAEIMAKLGFGMMVIMQNEWTKAAADIQSYRDMAISVGHTPAPAGDPDQRLRAPTAGRRRTSARCSIWARNGTASTTTTTSRTGTWRTSKAMRATAKRRRPIRQAERSRGRASEDDGLLCLNSDRRHAGRLHPADGRTAKADRLRPHGLRLLLWRHAPP